MTGRAGSGIVKRSVMIAGHRTSVSLEGPFWEALRALARARGASVQALIGGIDAEREGRNLSSAIRVFVLAAVSSPTAVAPGIAAGENPGPKERANGVPPTTGHHGWVPGSAARPRNDGG